MGEQNQRMMENVRLGCVLTDIVRTQLNMEYRKWRRDSGTSSKNIKGEPQVNFMEEVQGKHRCWKQIIKARLEFATVHIDKPQNLQENVLWTYETNRRGPRIEQWGTTHVISVQLDEKLPIDENKSLFFR